jgi:gentisate 1,2-dioxygenase
MNTTEKINAAKGLDDLYPVFNEARYTAGWHKKRRSLWKEPATEFTPRHWSYAEAYAALEKASQWIDTELAERRNLLMFNPVGDNDYDTVRTLVSAYQMIKPNEHARAHRHTPNALRLVLDAGHGLFTVVNGVKIPMIPGDVLLTPGGCWHSHYNEGADTACWIDFLDVPLVHRLEPMFYEEHPDVYQTVAEEPVAHPYWFKRADIDAALDEAAPDENGVCRHLLASAEHMLTMDLTCIRMPAGARIGPQRDTASRIFAVTKGAGTFVSGDQSFAFNRGDVFAAPGWARHEITAAEDCDLFEVNDRPALDKLGFYIREAWEG